MQDMEKQTYQVEKITFVVTPVYSTEHYGESIISILLKLMKADVIRV